MISEIEIEKRNVTLLEVGEGKDTMGGEEEEGNLHCISWKEGKFKGRDGCPG